MDERFNEMIKKEKVVEIIKYWESQDHISGEIDEMIAEILDEKE